jgi:hypothetical protein
MALLPIAADCKCMFCTQKTPWRELLIIACAIATCAVLSLGC